MRTYSCLCGHAAVKSGRGLDKVRLIAKTLKTTTVLIARSAAKKTGLKTTGCLDTLQVGMPV